MKNILLVVFLISSFDLFASQSQSSNSWIKPIASLCAVAGTAATLVAGNLWWRLKKPIEPKKKIAFATPDQVCEGLLLSMPVIAIVNPNYSAQRGKRVKQHQAEAAKLEKQQKTFDKEYEVENASYNVELPKFIKKRNKYALATFLGLGLSTAGIIALLTRKN